MGPVRNGVVGEVEPMGGGSQRCRMMNRVSVPGPLGNYVLTCMVELYIIQRTRSEAMERTETRVPRIRGPRKGRLCTGKLRSV